MALLDTVAVLVTLAALLSYVNHRWVRLPTAVGLLGIALLLSLAVVAAGRLGMAAVTGAAAAFIAGIDFHGTLMQGMLSVLLFAGALHVDLGELSRQKGIVAVLATLGVVATTFLVGAAAWWVFGLLGLAVPFVYCLVFGALIAPTDPIAVLGVLKQAGVPRSVEIKITGESLFNDGIGVVVFLVLAGLAAEGGAPAPARSWACCWGVPATRFCAASTTTRWRSCSPSPWCWAATRWPVRCTSPAPSPWWWRACCWAIMAG